MKKIKIFRSKNNEIDLTEKLMSELNAAEEIQKREEFIEGFEKSVQDLIEINHNGNFYVDINGDFNHLSVNIFTSPKRFTSYQIKSKSEMDIHQDIQKVASVEIYNALIDLKVLKLSSLYVVPEYRGNGIATMLLKICIEFMKYIDFDRIIVKPVASPITLESNKGLTQKQLELFYIKNGFIKPTNIKNNYHYYINQ